MIRSQLDQCAVRSAIRCGARIKRATFLSALINGMMCLLLSQAGFADAPAPSQSALSTQQIQALVTQHEDVFDELIENDTLQQLLISHQKSLRSLAEIYENEVNWRKSQALQRSVIDNSVARRFKMLVEDNQYRIAELILTDGFGFNIAAWPLPTDYWQGDEAKFIEPMRQRKTYVSNHSWDESSAVYSFFVTRPIFINGQFYGVLIMGIDVSTTPPATH